MFQFGSPEDARGQSPKPLQTPQDFLQRVRKLTGLKKEDVFCNLRVPNKLQTAKDEINIVVLTGRGVFCIDLKPWRGAVSARNRTWHVQLKDEDQNFSNTCIEQVEDPVEAVTTKTVDLCHHLKRSGVSLRQKLLFPRVVFLSPDCELDEELGKREELVPHAKIDAFLGRFAEGYAAWVSDALTPSWLSGHLSYRQMEAVRAVLRRVGTWDELELRGGEWLRGDYRGCRFIALDRQEMDTLEFCTVRTLWALLGHAPQVTVRMLRRGSGGWLGKQLSASATIPSDTAVLFRVSGDEADAKIPAGAVRSITLSI